MKAQRRSGFNPIDFLSVPQEQADLISWIGRQRNVTFQEIQTHFEQMANVQEVLANLVDMGYVTEEHLDGQISYRVVYSEGSRPASRRLSTDLWSQVGLDGSDSDNKKSGQE